MLALAAILWIAAAPCAAAPGPHGSAYRGPGDITPASPPLPPWGGPLDTPPADSPVAAGRTPPGVSPEFSLGNALGRPFALLQPNPFAAARARRWDGIEDPDPWPVDESVWLTWWRLERGEHCAPLAHGDLLLSEQERALAHPALADWRVKAHELALSALDSKDRRWRAAGVLALGRLADCDSASRIANMLEDPDQQLRRQALLALGVCGGDSAREILLEVARGERAGTNSSLERGFAFVSLALCRDASLDLRVDAALDSVLGETRGGAREMLLGALAHQKLACVALLWPKVRALALDERTPLQVRATALESLAMSRREEDRLTLIDALHWPNTQLRRCAALALGKAHGLGLDASLIAALETESDAIARGFLSLSLGRQGSDNAVGALEQQRQAEWDEQRPCTLLALGLAGRAGNARARAALRVAPAQRLPAVEHAATLLAIGLARQVDAFEVLEAGTFQGSAASLRPFAAEGLGLLATGRARALVLERIEDEPDPATRAHLCDGLARMGFEDDAKHLLDAWRTAGDPDTRARCLRALARHGSRLGLRALLEIAAARSFDIDQRAQALLWASAMLSSRPPSRLAPLGRGANFLLFDAWMLELIDSGV